MCKDAAAATAYLAVSVCGAGTTPVVGGVLLQRLPRNVQQRKISRLQPAGYTEAAVALAPDLHKVASIAEKAVDMAQARQLFRTTSSEQLTWQATVQNTLLGFDTF